jgi:ubiquinone/menaquinone biosynthesis C-methylase UbiE
MIDSLDKEGVQRVVDRLEYRGKDEIFVAMREAYVRRMDFAPEASILDLGCGTGVVARALADRAGFSGRVVGIDYSPDLIRAAQQFAESEGVADRVEFRVGDAQALEDEDESYDAVLLHTVVSHVPDSFATLSEAARVVRRGGAVSMFDGDYASLTYATGDHDFDAEMVRAILSAVVANPYVMREVPSICRTVGLELADFIPHVHAEAGAAAFFSSLAEAYVPMAVRAQLVPEERAETWLRAYRQACASASSFASCNYYTYIAQRPA